MPKEERELPSHSNNSPQPDSSLSADVNKKQPNSTDSERNIIPTPSKGNLSKPSEIISPSPSFSELSPSEQLSEARANVQLRRIEREEKIKAIDDWIGFITIKTVGISSLAVGGLEIIVPSLLTLSLAPPFTSVTLVGIGLAFLTGKKSISLVKQVIETLAEDDNKNNS